MRIYYAERAKIGVAQEQYRRLLKGVVMFQIGTRRILYVGVYRYNHGAQRHEDCVRSCK